MSFIIKDNIYIAEISDHLKSGTVVNYSYQSTLEKINVNFGCMLVNAKEAKISNAKKWIRKAYIDNSEAALVNDFSTDDYLVFTPAFIY